MSLFALSPMVKAQIMTPGMNGFFNTIDGHSLRALTIHKQPLDYVYGYGQEFRSKQRRSYQQILRKTLEVENYPLQWSFRNLSKNIVIKESKGSQLKFFGASVSKIFVAGALLNKLNGALSSHLLIELAKMIVVSDNRSWAYLQKQIGAGSSDSGKRYIHEFTQDSGYKKTVAFRGWLGSLHGNEITAHETNQFIQDTFDQRYPGASTLWKVMYSTRTGKIRGRKYLPRRIYVGGKTGTYAGSTVDPQTGAHTFPDGTPYKVNVHHHALIFSCGKDQFSIVVLNNTGKQENLSILVGGLIEEYLPQGTFTC